MISGVDEKGVGWGMDWDPLAIVLDLKPTNLVLHEECQKPMICVWGQAHCELWFRTRWVIVYDKHLGPRFQVHLLMDVVFL